MRAGVLGDVGHGFLRDAIQRRFDFRREPLVQRPDVCNSRGNVDARRPVLHVVRQRRPQAEVVEGCRPELPDEMVDVAIEALGDASSASTCSARSGVSRQASFSAAIRCASAVNCSPN